MTEYFTAESRLFRITHCKEFAPFRKYMICPRRYRAVMQGYKIKHLQSFYRLDPRLTAGVLNAMRDRIIQGQSLYHDLGDDVALYSFIKGKGLPFVLILAGGGYGDVCSLIEGFPIAARLNALGLNAFVGQYRVGKKAHYPHPQDDVAKMVSYILGDADAICSCDKNYAVCGFSAGGHLAASWGTKRLGYARYGLPKPSALFLAYPVVTMGDHTHLGSRKNLLGADAEKREIQDLYSIERQVDEDYPPTYIWHCKDDQTVSFINSQMLADSLALHHVPYSLTPVEGTAHGWGLADGTAVDGWLEKAVAFWQKYGVRL